MLRASYIGDAAVGGAGAGQYVMATVSPGAGYVALDRPLSEAQIARARASGALAKKPCVGAVRPANMIAFDPAWSYSDARHTFAAGNGMLARIALGDPTGGSPPGGFLLGLHVGSSTANSWGGGGALVPSSQAVGLSFAHGEFHWCTSVGLYSSALRGGAPFVRFGVGHIAGAAAYDQVRYIGGIYVAFGTSGPVPKYSADRIAWTTCTIPALSADAGGAGNAIVWIEEDERNGRLIGITAYGEILTTSDGLVWTKSLARAGGGTSQGLGSFARTPTGKLLATGSTLANGQVFVAPSEAAAFSAQAIAISGKTFASRALGVAFTAGVIGVAFASAASSSNTALAVSVDDGVTFSFAVGGDGSQRGTSGGQFACIAAEGVIVCLCATNDGNVLDTDLGPLLGTRFATFTDAVTGLTAKPYLKVA